MRILLTGATGFVGGAVATRLESDAVHSLLLAMRSPSLLSVFPSPSFETIVVPDLSSTTDWTSALEGRDVVIHSAARAHVMNDKAEDSLRAFREVNTEGTLALARQAAEAGVKRFIFISSIKVNGEGTPEGCPYTAFDAPAPVDPYGISKHEAEEGLKVITAESGMEVVIIRSVLVYGPGVKANFRTMMNWLTKGVPLPLGAIDNKRSLVALDNLVDLIVTCIDHPAAANQTFLVSDGEDLSVTQLLRRLGKALDTPVRLVPVPVWVLNTAAAVLGKRDVAQRLCGGLQVDIRHTCETLSWAPPVSVDEGLSAAAEAFLSE